MTLYSKALVVCLALALRLAAQPAAIAEAEADQAPTAARLAELQNAARVGGWAPQVAALRAAALLAYQRDKLAPAEAWSYVYRWAAYGSWPYGQMYVK